MLVHVFLASDHPSELIYYFWFVFVLGADIAFSGSVDDERSQPEQQQIKTAILLFPSRVVLYRGFRQAAPREVRNITSTEFKAVAEDLAPSYGDLVITRLRRQSKDSLIFVKRCPTAFQPFSEEICSLQQYTAKFECRFTQP